MERRVSATFKAGVISLAFLIVGYEAALFVHRASVLRIQERRDHPDTVFIYTGVSPGIASESAPGTTAEAETRSTGDAGTGRKAPGSPGRIRPEQSGRKTPETPGTGLTEPSGTGTTVRKNAAHPPAVEAVRHNTRRVENFRFNPNTVSVEDLMRLGFSRKQAASIENYRAKGGRFRRRGDFAKSFVVSDSVYRRLEPFIDIPLLDINEADSAAFDALPGVGAWTAGQMVSYRAALGGYSCTEQLMDIYRFDRSRFDAIADLIVCGPGAVPFDLWGLPAEELRKHPCIRSFAAARAVVLYRDNNPRSAWTVEGLRSAGILDSLAAEKLGRCALVPVPPP